MDDVVAPESPTALSLGAQRTMNSMASPALDVGSPKTMQKTLSKET